MPTQHSKLLNSIRSVTKSRLSTNLLFNEVTESIVKGNVEITRAVEAYICDTDRWVFEAQ